MTFFEQTPTVILNLSLLGRILSIALIPVWLYVTKKCQFNTFYIKSVKWTLAVMMLLVYVWYFGIGFPLHEALPLYHCRIGMFALLLLPDGTKIKQYFALLGVGGACLALILPAFYPYPLFHVTNVFFFVGHYGLLVLSYAYLLNMTESPLELKEFIQYTLIVNAVILGANLAFRANYGFLSDTPLLHTRDVFINYFLVSTVIVVVVHLISKRLQKRRQ